MSQAHLTLHDLLPPQEPAPAIDTGHVTRKAHQVIPTPTGTAGSSNTAAKFRPTGTRRLT